MTYYRNTEREQVRPVYTDGDFEPCPECGGLGTIESWYGPNMCTHFTCGECDGSGEVFLGEETE